MSYVQANTSNPLGRRNLGRMRGLGWDNPPYPVYPLSRSVRQLNGLRGEDHDGAITYRIDPRSGKYNFYRTDIKPRGVFLQNTFQHPAPPVMSALGMRVLPIGKSVTGATLQRGRVSQEPLIALRPGVTLSGLGCGSCGGRCKSCLNGPRFACRRGLRGLGDPCGPQPDGSIVPCPPDPSMATEQGDVPLPGVTPVVVAPAPGTTRETIDLANRSVSPITFSFTGAQPSFSVGPQQRTQGVSIPTNVLWIGGALMAALVLEGGRGRRR